MSSDFTDVEKIIRFLAAAHVAGALQLEFIQMKRDPIEVPTHIGGPRTFVPSTDGTLELKFHVWGDSVYDFEQMRTKEMGEVKCIRQTKLLE
jgi:hypothetical protein